MKNTRNTLQVWYTNDYDLDSSFSRIKEWFTDLIHIGTYLGYYTDPGKILLVTLESNLYLAATFFS